MTSSNVTGSNSSRSHNPLWDLWGDESTADTQIRCKDRTWKVHRDVLRTRSKFFRQELADPSENVFDIKDCEPEAVHHVLETIYLGDSMGRYYDFARLIDILMIRDSILDEGKVMTEALPKLEKDLRDAASDLQALLKRPVDENTKGDLASRLDNMSGDDFEYLSDFNANAFVTALMVRFIAAVHKAWTVYGGRDDVKHIQQLLIAFFLQGVLCHLDGRDDVTTMLRDVPELSVDVIRSMRRIVSPVWQLERPRECSYHLCANNVIKKGDRWFFTPATPTLEHRSESREDLRETGPGFAVLCSRCHDGLFGQVLPSEHPTGTSGAALMSQIVQKEAESGGSTLKGGFGAT